MMSRGIYPFILMPSLAVPLTASALGLGEIRVSSALNEPLAAEIEILGGSADELAGLRAAVASREIFQRFGVDRPSFLSSAKFKVGRDAAGRPVLEVRSEEAFTDPLVSLLVDLQWGKGEVIREYSLLLDPPAYEPAHRETQLASAAGAATSPAESTTPNAAAVKPVAASERAAANAGSATVDSASLASAANTGSASTRDSASVAGSATNSGATSETRANSMAESSSMNEEFTATVSSHRVAPNETLQAIARQVGARSKSQTQRMMIAIFRANPGAFEGNINRLRQGVQLEIPAAAAVASITRMDAKREVRAQMMAWRALASAPRASTPQTATAASAALPSTPQPATETETLTQRVQTLEQSLSDMKQVLADKQAAVLAMQLQVEQQQLAQAQAALQSGEPPVNAAQVAPPVAAAPTAMSAPTAATEIIQPPVNPAPVAAAPSAVVSTPAATTQIIPPPVIPANVTPVAAAPAAVVSAPSATRTTMPTPSPRTRLAALAAGLGLLLTGAIVLRPRRRGDSKTRDPNDAVLPDNAPGSDAAVAGGNDAAPLPLSPPVADPTTSAAAPSVPGSVSAARAATAPASPTRATAPAWPAPAAAPAGPAPASTPAWPAPAARALAQTASVWPAPEPTPVPAASIQRAQPASSATTVKLAITGADFDFGPIDLESTVQHVHMASGLNEQVVVAERRTNLVEALNAAIAKDPHRSDLRLKLLEVFHSAAASNRQAFLDVAHKMAGERDALSADEWEKLQVMGRQIAPDDELFSEPPAPGSELADCA